MFSARIDHLLKLCPFSFNRMTAIWGFSAILVTWVLIRYHWSRRHFYTTALNLSGPISLPIIGSTFPFIFCKTEDLLQKLYEMGKKFEQPFAFWLGPQLIITFKQPQHIEKILCSSKFSHKHEVYELLKGFLGEGLITASGPIYKVHKKMVQPCFGLQFSASCIQIFEKHVQVCVEKLEQWVDKDYVDIGNMIHLCTADIIGDVVLGYNFQSQRGQNLHYIEAFTEVYKIGFTRIVKPWLHPEVIFRSTMLGRRFGNICKLADTLMQKATDTSLKRRKCENGDEDRDVTPVIDTIAEYIEANPGEVSVKDFWSHLVSLYMASQDTIALITSAACLLFGMYPEYQEKAIQEIHEILGKNPEHLEVEKIAQLKYLDMCVKEVFRLFPIAPYIFRKNLKKQKIDQWSLPEGCGICIPIYNLHKDSKYWENPDHFHPDHFLDTARPEFSYIPFSAGPRGCIGKVFANISVKVLLITLLKKFEIWAPGKLPDLKLTMDISTRSQSGYRVKLKRR